MNFDSPGSYWPALPQFLAAGGLSANTAQTLNAATLKLAFIGRCFIYGRPSGAKTLSAAGGGGIGFRAGAVTFSNASTSIDIGVQGVSTSAGPAAQPNGTFGAKLTSTSSSNTILANNWNFFSFGSGSSSIAHGDMIAVVFDMTARGGSDSIIIQAGGTVATGSFPVVTTFNGTVWLTTGAALMPNVRLNFDDGTRATIDGSLIFSSTATESFKASTNPNERGILFQVPADCYIDAFWAYPVLTDANSGFTFSLYSNPIGGQSSLATLVVDPHQLGGGASGRWILETLPTQQLLRANSEYGLSILATGTSNLSLSAISVSTDGDFRVWPGGANANGSVGGHTLLNKITRNGSSGNFTAIAATTYSIGVRIASFLYANTLVNGAGLVA